MIEADGAGLELTVTLGLVEPLDVLPEDVVLLVGVLVTVLDELLLELTLGADDVDELLELATVVEAAPTVADPLVATRLTTPP